jgi:hypothetical protein
MWEVGDLTLLARIVFEQGAAEPVDVLGLCAKTDQPLAGSVNSVAWAWVNLLEWLLPKRSASFNPESVLTSKRSRSASDAIWRFAYFKYVAISFVIIIFL